MSKTEFKVVLVKLALEPPYQCAMALFYQTA